MGWHVDQPRSWGGGTSNDGNTARTFFSDTKLSADITGLDENVFIRCAILLQCMASGYKINSEKFGCFGCIVHKVLFHGYEIISYALVLIGELSKQGYTKISRVSH